MGRFRLGSRRAVIGAAALVAPFAIVLGLWSGLAFAAPAEPTFTAACTNQATVAAWTNLPKLRLVEFLWYTTDPAHAIADGHLESIAEGFSYLQANGSIQTTSTLPGALTARISWGWHKGSGEGFYNADATCTSV